MSRSSTVGLSYCPGEPPVTCPGGLLDRFGVCGAPRPGLHQYSCPRAACYSRLLDQPPGYWSLTEGGKNISNSVHSRANNGNVREQ